MTFFRCLLSASCLACACMMASPASAESKGDAHWNFEDAANKEFAHIRPAETVNLKADVLEIAPAAEKKGGLDAQNREKWLEHAKKNPDMVLGQASWYGRDFDRKATASGLPYDMYTFTAAHRTLPLGTVVRVTDQFNGRSVMVCVTDRGPYAKGRILDLSYAAADVLDLRDRGVANIGLEVVSDAKGKVLSRDKAFFVQLETAGKDKIGPFDSFADAAALHEACAPILRPESFSTRPGSSRAAQAFPRPRPSRTGPSAVGGCLGLLRRGRTPRAASLAKGGP